MEAVAETASVATTAAKVGETVVTPIAEKVTQTEASITEALTEANGMPGSDGITEEAKNNTKDTPIHAPEPQMDVSNQDKEAGTVTGMPDQNIIKDLEDKVSAAKDAEAVSNQEKSETPAETKDSKDNQSDLSKDADGKSKVETKLSVGSPTISKKLANNPEFQDLWGKNYAELMSEGKNVDRSKVIEKTISEYYDRSAKTQLEKGLPDEIKNDPLYNQKFREAAERLEKAGEPLDGNKLSQEALAEYQQEKDSQGENEAENKPEQLTTDKQLQEIQQRLRTILQENGEKLDSTKITISAKDLAELLNAYAETAEPNPKKKESKLKTLVRIIGIIVASLATETIKTVIPVTNQG